MVRTSVTHSAIASCATFLFLPHFDVICDLLLNRRTATWNLFVKLMVFRDSHMIPLPQVFVRVTSLVAWPFVSCGPSTRKIDFCKLCFPFYLELIFKVCTTR